MKMAPWVRRPQKARPITYTLSEGLNQSVESIELADGECSEVSNMDSFYYPTLAVRDGFNLFEAHTGYINRLFKFQGNWYCGNGKGLYKLDSGSWTAVYEYGDTDNERMWNYVIFLDKLYFVNGDLALQQYDGTTLTSVDTTPTVQTGANYIAVHDNRLFLASDSDNILGFSGVRDASDWTSTDEYVGSGAINVETDDGEHPKGIIEFADHVITFKQNTMNELFGDGPYNYEAPDPVNVGAISQRAITKTKNALFWLSTDGVYIYRGGNFPAKISQKIRSYIDSINMDYAEHCTMGTDNRFLYLTLVTGSNTQPNITLKYDLEHGSWWEESYIATAFYLDGQTLYYATLEGNIYSMGGEDDNGTAISWEWVSKPFTDGDEIHKKQLHKMWVIADIEVGSTFNVYYSTSSEGDTWTLAKSITPTGTLQNTKIPLMVSTPSEWIRVKLSGTGKAKVHRIAREMTRRGA